MWAFVLEVFINHVELTVFFCVKVFIHAFFTEI